MYSRNEIIDIAKGIGILLVVYGHSGLPLSGSVILYFHMPLFFFLSGLTFKENDSQKDFIVKRIKRLYIPFVIINTIFLILHPLLFAVGLEEKEYLVEDYLSKILKIITFQNAEPIISQCWYLLGLFTISIIFKLAFSFSGKKMLSIIYIFFAVCSLFSISFNIRFYYGSCDLLNVFLISSQFYLTGYLTRDYITKSKIDCTLSKCIVWGGGGTLLFYSFCKFFLHYESDFRSNIYTCVFLIFPAAFLGIFYIIYCAKTITKYEIKKYFTYLGRNTMMIFLLHTIAFKIVDTMMIIFFNYNNHLYGWGHINGGIYWNLIHFVIGVIFPLCVIIISNKINKLLRKRNCYEKTSSSI
jgi:fucose 4-O-acetylase-like acetyltransferase